MNASVAPPSDSLPAFVRITLRVWLKLYGSLISFARPIFDLVLRLAVAQLVFASGVVKLADYDTALFLAANEYPVSWMAPGTAAAIGVTIEVLGPILLALGLFTRSAAIAIGALFLVSQIFYKPVDVNLFVIALMAFLAVRGAGAFSLDRLLARGMRDSAFPIAPLMVRIGATMSEHGTPWLLLVIRIWLGLTLLAASGTMTATGGAEFLPVSSFVAILAFAAILFALAYISGALLPVVTVFMVVGLTGAQIAGVPANLSFYALLVVLLFLFYGAGQLSVDRLIGFWSERNILFDKVIGRAPAHWPHVVVVGGGFGGLKAVTELKKLPVRITLIDRHNYHLFQPLLYQIATASLSPADVATPIRGLYRGDGNVRVLLGEVDRVDADKQLVHFGRNSVDYDWLVLATGATHSYFGKDEWAPFAPGLKRIEDGVAVRAHVLGAFEKAESSTDEERTKRLLNFVIVGAGPTGVELAGAIAELAKHGLKDEYRHIDPAEARIILIQSADRILPAFPEELSAKAHASLERLGVEIMLDSRVTDIQGDKVLVDEDKVIPTETVLWAAGVVASPAGKWMNAEADRAGRVAVDEHLRVQGQSHVFAIGDTAASMAWEGKPVPGLAPAAKQAGKYVSRYIRAQLEGGEPIEPFAYKHQGSLATIGRKAAVADFGWMKLSGAPAWWLWGAVHVGFLVGVRNRAAVLVNWVWSYFTLQLGIRLITGDRTGE